MGAEKRRVPARASETRAPKESERARERGARTIGADRSRVVFQRSIDGGGRFFGLVDRFEARLG